MLRNDIQSLISDRLSDLNHGTVNYADLPDILADEITQLLRDRSTHLILIHSNYETEFVPKDTVGNGLLKAALKEAGIGFAEADSEIIIGKHF